EGLEHVPSDRPVIFAVNHPNGLVDPLFILSFAPRPVSFLAKAPLLTMPVIGYFVRTLESIPVYRKQDNTTGSNEETFARAREVLRGGGSIAIFPEGTTHSDTKLRELKTGAARIALGSALPSLVIVPAGIYYTAKQTFRSHALVVFGPPILVPLTAPEPEAVHALTDEIEQALMALTLQAESKSALELIAQAEDIFTSDPDQPLAEELELRKRFVAAYHGLRERDPERLARVESEIRRFVSELGPLEPHELKPRFDAGTIARVLLLFPVAIVGVIAHFVPYQIVRFLSRRFSHGADEMVATTKFVASLAMYPLTWIAIAVAVALRWGVLPAFLTLAILPILGYAALKMLENLDDAVGRTRAVFHRLARRHAHERLVDQRRAIRRELVAIDEELRPTRDEVR
ncbi:MAG TPA: 1-acyl-sn-glycerol-3-phosphate acyltransferase, partial [Thermoanaerobaculia bacterium]|nr:1-acyl-sn-glycerol-3-phosphate acyltransferase [Thermoanaerobaculia bacterium]